MIMRDCIVKHSMWWPDYKVCGVLKTVCLRNRFHNYTCLSLLQRNDGRNHSQVLLDRNELDAISCAVDIDDVTHGSSTWGPHGDVSHFAHRL